MSSKKQKRLPTDRQIRRDIMTKLSVELWPTAGMALGLGRSSTYAGADNGEIKTINVGNRKPVPTAWLREKLGLNEPRAADKQRPGVSQTADNSI